MSLKVFDDLVEEAIKKPFSGWDFRYLTDRYQEGSPSWNYAESVRTKLKGKVRMLDMGTGGGEFLSGLQPLPEETFATECYEPNVEVAKARLNPLGVKVVGVRSEAALPFPTGYFDLIINRHEEFYPRELHRVLRSGGCFVTEQVGGTNTDELNQLLQKKVNRKAEHANSSWSLSRARTDLKEAGIHVRQELEESFPSRFSDIGAVVYFLKNAPWEMPDFDIERYREPLFQLHPQMDQAGGLWVTSERFFIEAINGV